VNVICNVDKSVVRNNQWVRCLINDGLISSTVEQPTSTTTSAKITAAGLLGREHIDKLNKLFTFAC